MNSMDYGAITVLRTLLLKINESKDWEKFLSLEHHNEDRKDLPLWSDDISVAKIIREQWKLSELFSEDEIHIVSSINSRYAHASCGLSTLIYHSCVLFIVAGMWNL